MRCTTRAAARLGGLIALGGAVAAAPSVAAAQSGSEDARIAALERELKSVESELVALKAARGSGTSATAPPGAPALPATEAGTTAAEASTPNAAGSGTALGGGASDALGQFGLSGGKANGGIAADVPTSAATASLIGGRPVIQSADGRFSANILGVMQWDAAMYDQATPGATSVDFRRGATANDTAHARDLSNGSDFRRARIGLGGKVFNDFEYTLLYDFGGSGEEDAGHIQELWFQYSGLKPFHFRVGAFAPSTGLEDAGSTNGMAFLERPAPSDIARSLAGGDFREGAQLVANGDRWFASAAVTGRLVGVVNSTASGISQPYDSQLGWVGRLAGVPFKGKDYLVHIGVHGSYVEHPADAGGPDVASTTARYPLELRERPELRVDGTRLIDTGAIDAAHGYDIGGEFAAAWRNLFLQGEYDDITIERRASSLSNPHFPGWYVEGTWLLTGEQRRYNTGNFAFDGPPVKHNFSLKDGGWGAFELAARYSDETLNYHAGTAGQATPADGVRGGEQQIVTAGLNWYLNPVIRVMFDYYNVRINRLSPSATSFVTPVGAQIGQTYNAFAVRSQLAF